MLALSLARLTSAILWSVHGLIVVVILIALSCTDRGVRLQTHAIYYRLRMSLLKYAGSGAAYSSVAQPRSGAGTQVPTFGRTQTTRQPGRAARGTKAARHVPLAPQPASEEEEEEEEEDIEEAPPPRKSRAPASSTRGRDPNARSKTAKAPPSRGARAGKAAAAKPPSRRKRSSRSGLVGSSEDEEDED
jgi:hypothetical protein